MEQLGLVGDIQASGDKNDKNNIRNFSIAYLRNEQDLDLAGLSSLV